MTLHVVRTDVLLHALGGLGEVTPPELSYLWGYPEWLSREILVLAAGRARHGQVAKLSERSGRSLRSLRVQISRARYGCVPRYRRADQVGA